jgi:hypothetical protein
MGVRISTRGGAGVLLAAALATGGCAAGDGARAVEPGATTVSAPASTAAERTDAAVALAASLGALKKESYRFTSYMGEKGTMTGLINPGTKNREFVATTTTSGKAGTITIRDVDGVVYAKVETADGNGGPADGKWHRIGDDSPLNSVSKFDPSDVTKQLEMAGDVQWADADTVKGTIDLTKLMPLGGGPAASGTPMLTAMPFEASFDHAGRLADYRFKPEGEAAKVAAGTGMAFSDYGVRVGEVVAPPAAKLLPS